MASLYQRPRSPYWWIKSTGPDGRPVYESTGFRFDDRESAVKAELMRLERARGELECRLVRKGTEQRWEGWVEDFLDLQYLPGSGTHERMVTAWRPVSLYLSEKKIRTPRELTYSHCRDYVGWRTGAVRKSGKRTHRNTALLEIKFLRIICGEALRRGFIDQNPARGLGLHRLQSKEKPALTDGEIALIRRQLNQKDAPEWMSRSFEIALATGARQRETQIDWSNVDFTLETITFVSPKGGQVRAYTAPIITPHLLPLLEKWRGPDGSKTLTVPKSSGRDWRRFFNSIGLPHICFHCTRVSFVTRCCIAGIPESICRRLVNHAGEEVHRIYQRLTPVDIRALAAIPAIPSPHRN